MIPTRLIADRVGELFRTIPDALTVAADNYGLAIVKAPFSGDETNVASLSCDGSLAIDDFTTAGDVYGELLKDPLNGNIVVPVLSNVREWRFVANGGPYPVTIYGAVLCSLSDGTIYAVEKLAEPVTITGDHQFVNLSPLAINLPDAMWK